MKVTTPEEIIREDDVIFDCVHCGKSLAIDARGAGLMITCPDCGTEVQVPPSPAMPEANPAPEQPALNNGNGIKDEDLPGISNVLSDAREQIKDLQIELEELRSRRRHLEKQHVQATQAIHLLKRQVAAVRAAMDQIDAVLKGLAAPNAGDTQPIG